MLKQLRKSKRGFTLIEMVVAVGILAVLAAVLVPTLIGVVNDANAKADSAQISAIRAAMQHIMLQAEMDDRDIAMDNTNKLAATSTEATDVTKADVVNYFDSSLVAGDFDITFTVDDNGVITGISTITYKGKS